MSKQKTKPIADKTEKDPDTKIEIGNIDIDSASPETAIAELKRRGYDDTALQGFAKAEKSWSEKGSAAHKMWSDVLSKFVIEKKNNEKEA